MKKIAILSLHLGYGGIEKSIVSLANSLCDKYSVEIACCYKLYDKCVFDLDERVKVKYLNKNLKPNHEALRTACKSKNIFKIIKEFLFGLKVLYYRKKMMVNYIKNKKCDVMIATRDIFNYWLSDFGSDDILKVGWEHNHFHGNYKYADNVVRSARKLDYLVLVSQGLQKFYAKALKNSSCEAIFIPNSIEKLPPRLASLEDKNLICVGRLSEEKGHLDLLRVCRRVFENYPDWKLNIIGDGALREKLESYIKKYHLEDNVILHGFQGKDYIDKELHRSSIYLMTSYTESFGIVLIEAMSHGVPCVAFDSAEGAKEIINSGENGYLIKNRNIDAMVMKIGSLIEKAEKRKLIGKKARESVKKYTSNIVAKEWIKVIEESENYE